MNIDGWKYYNHAAIPTTEPHETPDISAVTDGRIWEISGGAPYLVRWTTDFDCGYETEWWYCIKDTPFDLSRIKAKRRYIVNQGLKHFDVKKINPIDYKRELYEIQVASFSVYPKKYRPNVNEGAFKQSIDDWKNFVVFGAFFRETGELCGYSILKEYNNWADFSVQKTKPAFEKYQINAALVFGILERYNTKLGDNFYICDGARNVFHETAFQDYLEKYFEFRKAYCKLNLIYRQPLGVVVALLMPLRKMLNRLDYFPAIHAVNGIIKMQAIAKSFKE